MSAPTAEATAADPARPTPWQPHRRRATVVNAALGVLLAALVLAGLGLGDYPLTPLQVVQALAGADGFATTIVVEWRLPRVVAAVALGAGLATAGALFQSVTRNPLGSPDIVGFTTGAYTGVLVAMTLLPRTPDGFAGTAAAALAGGLLTAVVVFWLSYQRGIQGFRLIVVGIAVSAMLQAANTFLLMRAQTEVAMTAAAWGAGSLDLVGWEQAAPATVLIAVLGAGAVATAPLLRQLELGDDLAAGHGVAVEPARLTILAIGVALTAVATATAGPIAFVALSAPQIAFRLVRGAGLPLVASALTGAVLLVGADLVAQHLLPTALPVGIVTIVLGGAYLLALLVVRVRGRA
ncbi:iron chelate uptake ABC transporter family permease subunit [Isoptericola sp. NEAU-Y5]|uniref:Iron chelate uptake ABC transporter family permease subunit n=1 Tax=Isoptericola luteus TaxID=2879484 RepID=A0ABS7ZF17_9MICO|nr:iron chelate uptake ABC transporter family permease subunit [Isoptericola sp. NEAU-Y5]MCA5893635.1 iron chelate uptake ABC transporter family permease subunit [Isoptericola sp. NEAU-Y5]